jgi:hypothetical protein
MFISKNTIESAQIKNIDVSSLTFQFELQKILRDKYRIHITVNIGNPHQKQNMFYSNVIRYGIHHKSKFRSEFYNTYEEALEISLFEALRQIK